MFAHIFSQSVSFILITEIKKFYHLDYCLGLMTVSNLYCLVFCLSVWLDREYSAMKSIKMLSVFYNFSGFKSIIRSSSATSLTSWGAYSSILLSFFLTVFLVFDSCTSTRLLLTFSRFVMKASPVISLPTL